MSSQEFTVIQLSQPNSAKRWEEVLKNVNDKPTWSRYIAEALEQDGRTLEEIAARIGVHSSYLSRIKRGAIPSRAVLEALIRELDLDPQQARAFYEEALRERERTSLALKQRASLSLLKLGTPREEAERFFRDPKRYRAALALLDKGRGEKLTAEEQEALYAILQVLKGRRWQG